MKKKILYVAILVIVILFAAVRIGTSIIENNNRVESNGSGDLLREDKLITLNVFDKSGDVICKENLNTYEKYLIDVLNENKEKINFEIEDGPYGAYIISMMNIEQGDDFYWSYYINGEYASTGISNCLISSGDIYDFKIEQFNY